MQQPYQMSGASLPSVAPQIPTPAPAPEPLLEPPKRGRWWIAVVVIIVVAAGAYFYSKNRAAADEAGAKTGPAAIRTAAVVQGRLERTIRLSGTTGAARFSTLITPIMRGSRSGSISRRQDLR